MTQTQPDSVPTIGERATCEHCGQRIMWLGRYWDHIRDPKPRHIAIPLRMPVEPVQPDSAAPDITELDELAMAEARQKRDRYILRTLEDLRKRVDAMRSELAELKESVAELKKWRQTMTGDGR